jgi:hypothetical protein
LIIFLSFSKTVIVFLLLFSIYRLIICNLTSNFIKRLKIVLICSFLIFCIYQIINNRLTSISFLERRRGINYSVEVVKNNFLIGVGANNYLIKASEQILASFGYLQLQPVHNIYLLLSSEYGLIFTVGVIFCIFKLLFLNKKNKFIFFSLIFVVFSGLVDHYWVTLVQNQLILTILFGLAFSKVIKSRSV